MLSVAITPELGAATKSSDDTIAQDLRAYVEQLVARDEFSGAVLLAKGDAILFEQAYGYANHAFNAPNKIDTKFNLGSMSKMFTAVSVLQLAQQGKLSLQDKVLELVPDYPDKDIAAKITVHQLLTHTSGLGDFFNEKFQQSSRAAFRTTRSHLPLFQGQPLLFEPGARFSYSNAGFVVLGLIIEQVSGQSYYDYVRDHVFKPAGMTDTDNFAVDDDVPNLALGYTRMGPTGPGDPSAPRRTNVLMHVARGGSPGGGYSTVGDLLRFAKALQGFKLLDKQHTELMLTGKVSARGGKYGYGIGDSTVNGVRIVGHGGGFPGISGRLDMYPELGYTVVVLGNYDAAAESVGDRLRWVLTGGAIPRSIQVDAKSMQALAGRYGVTPPPGRPPLPPIEVAADQDGLFVTVRMRRRFLPLSATEFFDEGSPGDRLKFAKDAQGQVTGLSIDPAEPGPPLTATRMP